MEYVVVITRDEEANVWIAENSDIPIVLEDESLDNLIGRVKIASIELAEMNNVQRPSTIYFAIQAIIKERLTVNGRV